jgi:transcriptional regulator
MSDRFGPRSPDDIRTLIDAFPLAWIISTDASGDVLSSQLPLLPLPEADGHIGGLLGHIPRSNPLVARLREQPRVAILFQGPDAYASPSWYANRDSAPTWLFANVTLSADIALHEELTDHSLEQLVERMERDRPERWNLTEIGHRYHLLQRHVIAFVATIRSTKARFKLAQDEPPDVVQNTMAALGSHPIVDWLRTFNHDRLE